MNLGFVSSAMLRAASMAVPRALRSEWLKEWRAELWHVRHAQTDKSLLRAEQEIDPPNRPPTSVFLVLKLNFNAKISAL